MLCARRDGRQAHIHAAGKAPQPLPRSPGLRGQFPPGYLSSCPPTLLCHIQTLGNTCRRCHRSHAEKQMHAHVNGQAHACTGTCSHADTAQQVPSETNSPASTRDVQPCALLRHADTTGSPFARLHRPHSTSSRRCTHHTDAAVIHHRSRVKSAAPKALTQSQTLLIYHWKWLKYTALCIF